jgi:vacuolar-type H+-ATPase subunit H
MVYEPRRFEAPRDLEGLSAESRQIVLEARERLDRWIDENVDRLESEMRDAIEARRQELAAEVSAVQAELAEGKERLAEVLVGLSRLEDSFDAGDGMTVDEAVRATREAVQNVRSVLDRREQRIKGLAGAAVSAGVKAVTGL